MPALVLGQRTERLLGALDGLGELLVVGAAQSAQVVLGPCELYGVDRQADGVGDDASRRREHAVVGGGRHGGEAGEGDGGRGAGDGQPAGEATTRPHERHDDTVGLGLSIGRRRAFGVERPIVVLAG